MKRLGALVIAVALLAAGCSTSGSRPQVTVFAAASLGEAFKAMPKPFAQGRDDSLTFSFAGSQQLVAQLQQGAKADAVATADRQTIERVPQKGRSYPAVVFAGNRLVIAVGRGNPKHLETLADLARPELKVVLAAPAVPAGKYASDALAKAHVTANPVSLEDSVEGVVTKVALGEADAGIVYATDASPARNVDAIAIPDAQNVRAEYLARPLTSRGRQFVDFLRSPSGQEILRKYGFLPPP